MVTKEKETAWKPARAGALARTPGVHTHPTVVGLVIRATAKKGVYGWHFRDDEAKMQNGTYGLVAEAGHDGLTLERVLKLHGAKYTSFHSGGGGALTLSKAFTDWLKDDRKKGGREKSPVTLELYQECYSRYLEAEAGEWVLEKATSAQWLAILNKAKERSPHQARNAYWMMSSIYKRLIELDELLVNPMAKRILRQAFSGDDTKNPRSSQVPAIDLGLFVQGVFALPERSKQPRRAILYTLMSSWRKSAVLSMEWSRFDFNKGIYRVPPQALGWKGFKGEKKGFDGEMAVNTYMMAILQERIAEGGLVESEYVFPARHGNSGHMIDVRGSMARACKDLGYIVIPHDLRRTFATVGEVVLDGNTLLLGRLMAHAEPTGQQQDQAQAQVPGSFVTKKYIIRNLQAERVSGTKVAEAILEIAGVLPMSDEVAAQFKARGVDIKQRLALVDMPDDDEVAAAGKAVADEGMAEEESALTMAEAAIAAARRPRKSNNIERG